MCKGALDVPRIAGPTGAATAAGPRGRLASGLVPPSAPLMRRSTCAPPHGERPLGLGKPLEAELPTTIELGLVDAPHEVANDRRDEDLFAARVLGEPGGQDHAPTVEVAPAPKRLPRVQSDAHLEAVRPRTLGARGEVLLHGDGAAQSRPRAGKGQHEPVALR